MSGLPVYGFPPQFPGFQEQFRADLTGGGGMPSLDPRLVRQMSQGSSFGSPVGMGSLMGDAVISPDGSLGPAERPVPSRVPPWMDVQKQATAGAGLGPRPELPMAMAGPGGTEGSPLRSGEAGPMGGEQVALRRAGPLAPPAGAPRPLDAGIIGMPRETQDRMDQMEGEFDAARAKARADTEAAVAANNLAAQQRREERIKDIRSWGSSGAGAGPMQTEDLSLAPQRAAQPVRRFPAPSAPAEEQYKSVDPSVMGNVISATGKANAAQAEGKRGVDAAASASPTSFEGMSYQDGLNKRQSMYRDRKAQLEDPNNPAGAEYRAMMEAAKARGEYLRAGGDPKALPPMTFRGGGRSAVDPAAQAAITQGARQREEDYRLRQEQSRIDRGLPTRAQQNQLMVKRGAAEKDFRDARLGYSPPVTYIPPWMEEQNAIQREAIDGQNRQAADKAQQTQQVLDDAAKRAQMETLAASIAAKQKAGLPVDREQALLDSLLLPGAGGAGAGVPVAPAQADPAAIRDLKQAQAQGKEKPPLHVVLDQLLPNQLTPERIAELKQIYGEKQVSEYGQNLWSRSADVDEKMKLLGSQPTTGQNILRGGWSFSPLGNVVDLATGDRRSVNLLVDGVKSLMGSPGAAPRMPPPGMIKP